MSYCRFSSDDFKSDVYVYANVSGAWTIHVAQMRVVGIDNIPPLPSLDDVEAYCEASKAQYAFLDAAPHKKIGLPYDGETFDAAGPGECADKLEELRALGYHVPQYAIDNLRLEAAE